MSDANAPSIEDVERWWQELLAGRLTREEAHALARPWVEAAVNDVSPVVGLGLTHLHGADLVEISDSRGLQTRHGGAGRFVHSMHDLANAFESWRIEARSYEEDAAAWVERRLAEARRAVERERP